MASVSFQLQSEYGYVVLISILEFVVVQYLAHNVMKARKKYEVEYPAMYSDSSREFNCIQRAHQNALEVLPQFMMFLFLGGLFAPKLSAVFGLIYLASRIAYAKGYYTFDPKKRIYSAFGYVGLLGLILNTLLLGLSLLKWI